MANGKKMSQMDRQSKEADSSLKELQQPGLEDAKMQIQEERGLEKNKEEFDTKMELEPQSAEGMAKKVASGLLKTHFSGMMWLRSIHPDFDIEQFSKVQITQKIGEEEQ